MLSKHERMLIYLNTLEMR